MPLRTIATRFGIHMLCVGSGFAAAIAHVYLYALACDLGIQKPVSRWLEANGLGNWLGPWWMVCSHFSEWVLGFCCGMVIWAVFGKRSTLAAFCFSAGYLTFTVMSVVAYSSSLQPVERFGISAVSAVAIWDLVFIPVVLLGTSLMPNVRALSHKQEKLQYSVRNLLLGMLIGSSLLGGLAYAGRIGAPAVLLVVLTTLAWFAIGRAKRVELRTHERTPAT
ncbi:hypothetical protein Pan181_50430 [Aeoliella mucimassa]|uniref:Uncharacterized protein n=1 Tax=Aeoliella mucimassa TaxID=2527972 RepID=A0A518AVQ8_9BACT|nr:hypothetical protein Pan181_50430 [Aeoliella mucimassa]